MPQREDGACVHLTSENTCKIYADRPELCNIEKMYERRKEQLQMSKTDYFKMNNVVCNQLIVEAGLGKEYLIDIGSYDKDVI